jgi:hypothetical protein
MATNRAQLDVLEALSSGQKQTSNVTRGLFVSGVAAMALERQGEVSVKDKTIGGVPMRMVTITSAGRKALRDSKKPKKSKVKA